MIFDLIDTKAKELGLDYEEVIRFSGKMLDTKTKAVTNVLTRDQLQLRCKQRVTAIHENSCDITLPSMCLSCAPKHT